MAQTSHTGMLTERHAALLAQLRDVPPLDVLRIFEATGAFIGIVGAALIIFSRGRLRTSTNVGRARRTWARERGGDPAN